MKKQKEAGFGPLKTLDEVLPLLSGSVCANNSAVSGSNPKHNSFAFSVIFELRCKKVALKQKEDEIGLYLKHQPDVSI